MKTLRHFLTDLIDAHLIATNHVLRYLEGIVDYGIKYDLNEKINQHGCVDLDWVRSASDRKSTLGCFFSLGFSMIS